MDEQAPKNIFKERDGAIMVSSEFEAVPFLSVVNFDDFLGKDPYALEEEYQRLCKLKKFREAAVYLIGAAMNGLSDELDYILKIDVQVLRYVQDKDLAKIEEIISRIATNLEQ